MVAYALMALARKYQVDSLYESLVHRVKQEWPQTPEEYFRFVQDIKHTQQIFLNSSEDKIRYHYPVPEPASVIRLSTDFDIPSVLPGAYYMLATIRRERQWQEDTSKMLQSYSALYARWQLLHDRDNMRYYQGLRALAVEIGRLETLWDEEAYGPMHLQNCKNASRNKGIVVSSPCEKAISKCWSSHFEVEYNSMKEIVEVAHYPDPMKELWELLGSCSALQICSNCKSYTYRFLHRTIHDLWDTLPKMFGLM